MSRVLVRVVKSIEQHHLLSRGDTIVVGVSGGPDSVCLLHVLCRLREDYDLALHVAHLHHGLRGQEADADAAFVQTLAAEWSVPCTVEWADVRALADEHRLALEEAARVARYRFLGRVADSRAARTVAVGHHADDQAETVLMHWLRGAGLAGLRGMLPRVCLQDYRPPGVYASGAPSSRIYLIRPLLDVTRAEILAYCNERGLASRFDRSNLDTTYFRNWLRHRVLPLLASHNPNVRQVIRRSARVIADDYALLRSLLAETWPQVVIEDTTPAPPLLAGDGLPDWFWPDGDVPDEPGGAEVVSFLDARIVFDLGAWRALPTGLQRSTLREAIHRLRQSLRNINFVHVERALEVARDGTTGNRATLPGGLMLEVGYDRFAVADAAAAEPWPDEPYLPAGGDPLVLVVPGDTALAGSVWTLGAEIVDRQALPAGWQDNADPWRAFLDADAVGARPELRTRRPGDRFQPMGLGGHSSNLADFFTNQKVPRHLRDRWPLLVDEGGILWVCGRRLDERAQVRRETQRVLLLRFEKR